MNVSRREDAPKTRSLFWTALTIALPVIGQRLIDIAVNLADTMMLGQFGDTALSASSLANNFYSLFSIFCMGVSGGACVLANQYWGAGNVRAYKRITVMMLRICASCALLFAVVTALFSEQIMSLYSSDPAVIAEGAKYLRVTVWIYFFHGVTICMSNVLRSASMAWLPLLVTCASLFANIFFNWVFIFGNLGMPCMRVEGAALGTLLARILEFGLVAAYLLLKDKRIGFRLADLRGRTERVMAQHYWRVGFPVLVGDAFLAIGNNLVAMIIGNLGTEMSAANSVCSMIVQVTTVANLGLAIAGSVSVGQAIGRGEQDAAKRIGRAFFWIAIALGVAAGLALLAITPVLLTMYDQLSVLAHQYANQLMYSFALLLPFQTTSSVLAKGVLRGGGDTRFLMVADVLFLWCASVPLGYCAAYLWGLEPFWIQLFLRIDSVVKTIWCAFRLYGGKWIRALDK